MKNLLKLAALGLVIASTVVACKPVSNSSIKADEIIKLDTVSNKNLKNSNLPIKDPIVDTVSN